MVESPQAILFEPVALDDADTTKSKADQELLLVKQQPITSSFRSTIRHLHSRAGFRARFRGFAMYIAYSAAFTVTSQILKALPLPNAVTPLLATIILANLSMAWTHIVISDPSPKSWFKRLPAARLFKKVVGPTAVLAVAEYLSIYVPGLLAVFFGFADAKPASKTTAEMNLMVIKGLSVMAVSIAMALLFVLPANVMLTRVQASLLDDSEETIVPFDRSFGGKVVPEVVGGSGVIGMRDAWKTFDWNARVRLVKTYVKVFAMQMALLTFFAVTISAELVLIVGKSNLKKLIPSDGNDEVIIF